MPARAIVPRASLTIALLAACGGGASGTSAADTAPARPSADPAAVSPPPPSAPVPALPGGGERTFVIDGGELVEVSTAGGSHPVAPAGSWCAVDARANVVWFTADDGLRAFDLADRRARTIIKGELGELAVIIDWGKQQQLGGESKLDFDVGAALRLSGGKPTLEMEMGCDGDRAVYCFEDDLETPKAEVAALQQRAHKLKLADPAYAATLASRGKQGSLWSPPPVPPPMPKKKPTVDKKQCTEQPTCGTLTAIPGSPLWLVEIANSRGDFYHQVRELWDPSTGEYVRPDGAKLQRSKTPPRGDDPAGTDYGGLRVSPSGALSYYGYVFDPAKVHYAPKQPDAQSVSCGWAGGGWRIAGPTDG
jgi:hypothetical protein